MLQLHGKLIVLFLLGIGSAASAQLKESSRKPVYETEILPVVESSIQRMWESADAVAEVRIDASTAKAIARPAFHGREQLPSIHTLHTSRVLRVLKGNLKPGSTLSFSQQAGEVELADRLIRVGGPPPLAAQQRYVVFLRRQPPSAGEEWGLLGERDGAFKLHDGSVDPQGFGRVAKEHVNLRESAFNDELQRVAERTRPKY
jgi:hypothetical protein